MAKRKGAGSMVGGKRGGGRGRRGASTSQAASAGNIEMVRGRGKSRDVRGMLAGTGKAARNFGGSAAERARRIASSVGGAASGVASRTGETVSAAVGKVREHPWPALLIGAGVTWIAVDAIRGHSAEDEYESTSRISEEGPGILSRTASSIADAGRGAGEYVGDLVRERPLLAGAATLGIGMAVGMAMPSTSAENGLMGNMRDNVVRKAKDAARGTMDAVRDVAEGVERMAGGGSRERTR